MPRRSRDYRAEYRRRIERGLRMGLTRSQARGHGADRRATGPAPVAASPRALNPGDVAGYVRKLRPDRSVKVVATLESGAKREIGRGKAGPLLEYLEGADMEDRYGSDAIVGVQVIYQ